MLPNLNELIKPISEKIENFNRLDCPLPISFTSEVKMINRDTVLFGNSSSCIINRNGQRIFLSNNWFYIAAILAPLYEPFYRYKRLLNEIVDKDALKQSNPERIKLAINNRTDLDNQDKDYLIKFALEPLWWNGGNSNTGGKSLDRNDALVSPILSIANLVNASQSYVATLWEYFGENPRYATLLNEAADGLFTLSEKNKYDERSTPLQKIWFGTPGSGKSHKIKEELKGVASENIFRITFHPDSDYSCFVGAYKPTMEKRVDKIYTIDELIDKLSEIKDSGVTYPSQKFAVKYWRSLKQLSKAEKRVILQSCNMQDSLLTEFDKGIALGEEYLSDSAESRIIYSFIPQAFINAYIRAYQTSDSVYLIIEEINRGNCAQIFGDLFQLLDRGADGMSEYPIKADKDLCNYLESDEALGAGHPSIAGGNMRLPANLHIYATMNTSDQSLFPMDSAFKRRWDWEYVPIDLKCPESQFRITIGDTVYSWPSFLEKVNERIHTLSDSEDKQMGNFFIKTDVGVEEFKSKVMFYLWSEVCKEYEKSGSFFKNKRNGDSEFTFNSLFPTNAETNSILQGFMEYLGVETYSVSQPSGQSDTDSESHIEA